MKKLIIAVILGLTFSINAAVDPNTQITQTVPELQVILDDSKASNAFMEVQPTGDDAGIIFTGTDLQPMKNIVIGDRNNDIELCVGGDSTTNSMVVLQSSDGGSTFNDLTEIFASDSSSVAPMFASTASGEMIYFGGDFKYGGLKAKVDSIAASGMHGNIIAEVWLGAPISDWAPLKYMSINSTFDPFSDNNQRADNLATIPDISEQWHFDFDPWVQFIGSAKRELTTINGHELYWGRMRLTGPITTAPSIQQFKLGTDRIEIESTGIFRYGTARRQASVGGEIGRASCRERV